MIDFQTKPIMLSFIIPVYNTEAYIEQCVNSILIQCSSEIEIILVDDGSTDSSGIICDELAAVNSLIRVLHQKNMGHSSARNAGLKVATGKYVAFIDSDDFIGHTSLVPLLEWTRKQQADICLLNGYKYFSDGTTQRMDMLPKGTKIAGKKPVDALKMIARCEKFPGSACTKLFKHSFLTDKGVCFLTDRLHGEDLMFVLECLTMATSFDYLDTDYYYYRQRRNGSVSSSININRIFEDLSDFVVHTVEEGRQMPEKMSAIFAFGAYEYAVVLQSYCGLQGTIKKDAYKFFKKYKWILQYGVSKKLKFVRMCLLLLGISTTSRLMHIWMRIR